jgi:hypothetical protein
MTATPREHSHRDGYGRRNLDRPFWIVQCDECHVICNSGHHYDELRFAEAEADRHNSARHPA